LLTEARAKLRLRGSPEGGEDKQSSYTGLLVGVHFHVG
jgi:hypothetical protein